MRPSSPSSPHPPRAIWVQERDLAMLLSIGTARMLTVQMLEWLHFASWRTRYKQALEQARAHTNAPSYRPARQVHERLAGMARHGLLTRATRTNDRGATYFRRLPDMFTLTRAGAELLCARLGVAAEELAVVERRARAIQNVEHCIAIGQCYAALRAELEYRGRSLDDWMGDHRLQRSYDRLITAGGKAMVSLIPDATCHIAGQRYFIEIDRGTRPLRSWVEKTYAYEAYRGSAQLRARYDTDTFKVLIVAPTTTRLARIAGEVATVNRGATPDYLFTQASMIHPTTIRRGWNVIDSATLRKRQVVNTVVETADIQLARCDLWENPADET